MRPNLTSPIPVLAGLREIENSFDVILCDVWGVVHNGRQAHVEASKTLQTFRTQVGKRTRRVVLISNAPRPWNGVQTILDGYGIPRDAYDAIVTSGDLSQDLIRGTGLQQIHHIGPKRDLPIFSGCEIDLVSVAEAKLCVCTGLFDDDTETAEDYKDTLNQLLEDGVKMICANPDHYVERGGCLIPCAGLIGEAYEMIGGDVVYAGKPHREIYEAAIAKAASLDDGSVPDLKRVLSIGDSIRTDVSGSVRFGIPALLIARGIHAEEIGLVDENHTLGEIDEWLAQQAARPDAVMDRLVW